jgi:ribosomal protein S18 acetylase RimI-like enzyme
MVEENQIPIKAFLDAYPRRIDYYQRLYTVNDCLHAIYKNKIGISLSFDIFSSFESARNGDVQYPQIGEKYLGSHSVHVGWGNKGKGTLPFKYFEDGLVSEAWAMSGAYCDPIGGEKVFSLRTKQGCDFKLSIKCYPSLRHSPYPLSSFDITVGGVHVGHLHLSFYDEENLEIEEFYILPQFQKQGIGTTAMQPKKDSSAC